MSIRTEVEGRLAEFGANSFPTIPIAYENRKFTRPDGKYLEVTFLGKTSVNRDVSADGVTTTGMFQVACYAPIGKGMGDVEALAESVSALFPVLPKSGGYSVEAPPSISQGLLVDVFMCVVVTVRYRAEY